MTVIRMLARPMVGARFVFGGFDALRHPETRVEVAEPVAPKVAQVLHLPPDTKRLVRINGAVQLAAGALLSIGKLPRLSALALAGTLVPSTWAGHAFWKETDKQIRADQQQLFLKNVSTAGGLLFAATDRRGRPSLAWRTKRADKHARRAASRVASQAKLAKARTLRAGAKALDTVA